nr:hypothetical protein Itr_chr04CG18010 [Ipomoea trifida]
MRPPPSTVVILAKLPPCAAKTTAKVAHRTLLAEGGEQRGRRRIAPWPSFAGKGEGEREGHHSSARNRQHRHLLPPPPLPALDGEGTSVAELRMLPLESVSCSSDYYT